MKKNNSVNIALLPGVFESNLITEFLRHLSMPVSLECLQLELLEYKQWALPSEATARAATLLKKQKGKCTPANVNRLIDR